MTRRLIGVLAFALAGCTADGVPTAPPTPPAHPSASAASSTPVPEIPSDTITYGAGMCYGTCPIYSVTVSPDGTGVFTGERYTAVTGTRRFTVTPAQYRALAARLAPYRPVQGDVHYVSGNANCPSAPTDGPSASVRWTGGDRGVRELYFYSGCARYAPALADALRAVPDMLPIGAYIGQR